MKHTEMRLFLDRAGVDAASEQMACWLAELGVPSRDTLRIRLTMEELLLRISEHYCEEIDCTLRMGKYFGVPFISFRYAGEAYDPTGEQGNEMSRWTQQLLANMGLISSETAYAGMLNNPAFFRAIYQISGIWESAGYDSIVFFAAVIAISPTSYEAAQIDGAGKMAQMRYVVLPAILSTIVIMLITRIGSLLNIGYEKVLLLYNPNTYVTADVVSTFAQRNGIAGSLKGLASAAEMMNNIIGMLLVIGANTIAKKASDTSLY